MAEQIELSVESNLVAFIVVHCAHDTGEILVEYNILQKKR